MSQRSNMPFLIGIVNFETWWQIIDDLDNIQQVGAITLLLHTVNIRQTWSWVVIQSKMRAISLIILIIGYVASAGVNKMLCKSGKLILFALVGMVDLPTARFTVMKLYPHISADLPSRLCARPLTPNLKINLIRRLTAKYNENPYDFKTYSLLQQLIHENVRRSFM